MNDAHAAGIGDDGYLSNRTHPSMSRGLSQVLFNYLPERTFDYDRGACIGKVFELRLDPVKGIDVDRLCAAIEAYIARWETRISDFDVRKSHLLLFGRPTKVLFNLFPLTFQCGLCDCVRTFEREEAFVKNDGTGSCLHCGRSDRFEQIYHVLVHECGRMAGLVPRQCATCRSRDHMALDLRGSQQARDFRWLCKQCGTPAGPVQRRCPDCAAVEGERDEDSATPSINMRVIPHRANNAYYPHNVTVLNLPTQQTAALRDHPQRDQILATAVIEQRYDLDQLLGIVDSATKPLAPSDDTTGLLDGLAPEEQTEIRRSLERLAALRRQKSQKTVDAIATSAAALGEDGWLEILEFLNVHTLKRVGPEQLRSRIEKRRPGRGALVDRFSELAREAGLSEVQLVQNFPVVTAVFGYTRVSPDPISSVADKAVETTFRGFSTLMTGPHEQKRKRPIFVDDASTEALLFKLAPSRVARWLRTRGHDLPANTCTDDQAALQWLLQNMRGVDTFVTLASMPPFARDVFVLTHTFAHIAIRSLTRLSGIDRTGLAEYLFPRVASFVVYNTKAGANLGGLHTVYAEMQEELLCSLKEDPLLQTCVYDPLCSSEHGASCHACTHLPEMCCKHYNRGLSRGVLFGSAAPATESGYWNFD